MKSRSSLLFLICGLLFACTANNVLTKEEVRIQSESDAVVSGVLFEHELTESASYNVRKNGFVAIKFEESVSEKDYTNVVKLLRSSPAVNGVFAEQSGDEVCGLR